MSKRIQSVNVKRTIALAAAAAAWASAGSAQAANLAYWHFNDAVGNTANWLAVDSGSGTMTTTSTNALVSTTGTTVNQLGATVAGNAIGFESKNNVASPNYIWASSTAGQSDIWFSYAANNAGGYSTMTVGYSTNGTTFTDLASQSTSGSFTANQVDLSGVAALNNNANAKFRVTLSGGSNGNNMFFYIDNVQINSGNNSQITTAASLALGRVIQNGSGAQNFNLTKAGVVATSYTASGTGLSVTADGTIASGAQTEVISVGLANDASGSATTGVKALTLAVDNTAATSFGAGLGSADTNDSVSVSATVVANRVVSASSVNFGRRMVGVSLSGTSSSLTTTGDNNNNTAVTVGTTVAADSNGVSITGGSGTSYNSAGSTGTRNMGGSFSTTGLKSGSRTLTTTGEGLAGEAPINVVVNYSGTSVTNRVVSASSVALGRVMAGQAVSGSSNLTTTLDNDNATAVTVGTTVGADANGISISGGSGTLFNSAGSTGSRTLGGTFATTGVKSGTRTLTTTGEGLSGESAVNVNVGYTATALNNRVVTGSSVNLGSKLVGVAVSGSSNLSTTGDNNNFTAVSVATTGGPNGQGISVTGGSGTSFNAAGSTGSRSVGGSFALSGNKSSSVTLTTTGEGIAGEAPVNVNVPYTAAIYQSASVTSNGPGPLGAGGLATVTNAASDDGGQRAAAFVDNFNVAGHGFGVSGLTAGTTNTGVTTVASASLSGTVTFASAGKLNGTHLGSLAISVENDQSIGGATNLDLNGGSAFSWNLAQNVAGNSGAQSSIVPAGTDLGNLAVALNGVSNQELGSVATLLDSNALSAQRTLSMNWRARNANEKYPTGTTPPLPSIASHLVSDVVNFGNTGSDAYVLQLAYDESELVLLGGLTEVQLAAQGDLYLAYFNGVQWENAVVANSLNVAPGSLQNYQGSYAASGAGVTLGAYGVDTANNTVWAVVDHNSEFSVGSVVPEPSSAAVVLLAGGGFTAMRRRRRSA